MGVATPLRLPEGRPPARGLAVGLVQILPLKGGQEEFPSQALELRRESVPPTQLHTVPARARLRQGTVQFVSRAGSTSGLPALLHPAVDLVAEVFTLHRGGEEEMTGHNASGGLSKNRSGPRTNGELVVAGRRLAGGVRL